MQRISHRILRHCCWQAGLVMAAGLAPCMADQTSDQARLSLSAYRALGQIDLQANGVNMVDSTALSFPAGLAVDSDGHLFVSDTFNHRIQAWTSASAFQNGEPAALTLGQATARSSNQLGIGVKGFSFPWGLAVDPATGNVYVADLGNNRVLRFPKPFSNPERVDPDAVFGQPDFNTRTANSGGLSEHSLNAPRALAFDSHANLWVADTGNNRVLRFPAAVLNNQKTAADLVLGQPDFHSSSANGGKEVSASAFNTPMGVAFDAQANLYVADSLNARVLKFPAPVTSAAAATVAYGQPKLTTTGIPPLPTPFSMAGPEGVALDKSGTLYVAIAADNRVLVFAPAAVSGDNAKSVLGQPDFVTVTANTGAFPQASASSLAAPAAVAVDSQGDILVADTGNSRVLSFPAGSKSATRVIGQSTSTGNSPNQVKAASINAPYKIAIDYSHSPFALYVSDTNNHRVLIWKDSAHFHTGDPADMVIGQPNLLVAVPNADAGGGSQPSRTSLAAPRGIAVAPDGTLYVSDSGNNRVLRYPRPVDQAAPVTPDAVLGQSDFTSAASAALNAASMHTPSGVALGPNGNIFVADTGNNRVLEFAAGAATSAAAIRVYGQTAFTTGAAANVPSAQTLSSPQGLVVDPAYNLYVADSGANRVLIYPNTDIAPPAGLPASIVMGQVTFDAGTAAAGATRLNIPVDVALDKVGNIFVSDTGNNRIVVFPSRLYSSTGGTPAYLAIGQQNLDSSAPNWNSTNGLATPEGLWQPIGIFIDRVDTLYVGDTGNNRVVHFLKTAVVANGARWDVGVPVGLGSWSVLGGDGFSTDTKAATSVPLLTSLAGRELVINDQLQAPLLFVSPKQVNFLLPSKAPVGLQRIAVRAADTGELIAGGSVSVATYSPGFFTQDQNGQGQAAALNQDNTRNSASNPASLGSVVQMFGTGQGPLSVAVADGHPAPANALTQAKPTADANTCLNQQPSLCVALGGSGGGAALAEIQYSGLAPGLVGVWQLNIKLPSAGLLGNSISVRALLGGSSQSNLVSIAVK
jgi:uncharacterized protein (TIGR03437 family)